MRMKGMYGQAGRTDDGWVPLSREGKRMRKVLYIDMDGVLNLFEHDPDARINMWNSGYFGDISPRENIESDLVMLSGYFDGIGHIDEMH